MGNWVRCALKVMAVTLTVSAGLALAGPNDQDQDGLISVTATIDNVECLRCFHWNGVGGAKRVADKLIATVSNVGCRSLSRGSRPLPSPRAARRAQRFWPSVAREYCQAGQLCLRSTQPARAGTRERQPAASARPIPSPRASIARAALARARRQAPAKTKGRTYCRTWPTQ